MSSVIVTRPDLPDSVFHLLRLAFPDDDTDVETFWPPDSIHVLVYDGDKLVAHAGILERTLHLPDRDVLTAYVEYVAAEPRKQGHGTAAMRALAGEIDRRGYVLAALATGSPEFYARLRWRLWRGPTGYRRDGRVIDVPDEKRPMVLDLGAGVDLAQRLECDWREVGDAW